MQSCPVRVKIYSKWLVSDIRPLREILLKSSCNSIDSSFAMGLFSGHHPEGRYMTMKGFFLYFTVPYVHVYIQRYSEKNMKLFSTDVRTV